MYHANNKPKKFGVTILILYITDAKDKEYCQR